MSDRVGLNEADCVGGPLAARVFDGLSRVLFKPLLWYNIWRYRFWRRLHFSIVRATMKGSSMKFCRRSKSCMELVVTPQQRSLTVADCGKIVANSPNPLRLLTIQILLSPNRKSAPFPPDGPLLSLWRPVAFAGGTSASKCSARHAAASFNPASMRSAASARTPKLCRGPHRSLQIGPHRSLQISQIAEFLIQGLD